MRIIAKFTKGEAVRFVSHLDIQSLFQRGMRRARIPLAYSQGFNPHPLLSFATALSVGYTSAGEWLDVKLGAPMEAEAFQNALNAALPFGFSIVEAHEKEDAFPSLSSLMAAAAYSVPLDMEKEELRRALEALLAGPILVQKRSKAGMRSVDIRPHVFDAKAEDGKIRILGRLDAAGSLPLGLFLHALLPERPGENFTGCRDCIYSLDGTLMPPVPSGL